MGQALEDEVRRVYTEGVDRGKREYEAIRANAVADEGNKPSPEYEWVEDLVRFSDLAEFRGAIEGLRDAVFVLARAIDEDRSRRR